MQIINISKDTVLGDNLSTADNFFSRFAGLMFRKALEQNHGLVIKPCNSIHTLFMRFPIDVVFIDKNDTVVYIVENLKPWKFSKVIWNSKFVIELPAGTISNTHTQIGDKIKGR